MSRAHHASILGVSVTAGEAEVKAAYRRMVKKYHPDINGAPNAVNRFLEIKKAYDYLLKYPYGSEPQIRSRVYYQADPNHPAQKREEEYKRRREQRMKHARDMRKRKEEQERLAWEKWRGSMGMWVLVFFVLSLYFLFMGGIIGFLRTYPYETAKIDYPNFMTALFLGLGFGATYGLYAFYRFLYK